MDEQRPTISQYEIKPARPASFMRILGVVYLTVGLIFAAQLLLLWVGSTLNNQAFFLVHSKMTLLAAAFLLHGVAMFVETRQ